MNAQEAYEKMMQCANTGTPMPQYVSHKKVWALKIKEIHFDYERRERNVETDGTAVIIPEESAFGAFVVDAEYIHKHQPKAGGYYIVYKDGYKSWSPAEAFEEGYTRC